MNRHELFYIRIFQDKKLLYVLLSMIIIILNPWIIKNNLKILIYIFFNFIFTYGTNNSDGYFNAVFLAVAISLLFHNINLITLQNYTMNSLLIIIAFLIFLFFFKVSYLRESLEPICDISRPLFRLKIPCLKNMLVTEKQKYEFEKIYELLNDKINNQSHVFILENCTFFYAVLNQKSYGSIIWYHKGVSFLKDQINDIDNEFSEILNRNHIKYLILGSDYFDINEFPKTKQVFLKKKKNIVFEEAINGFGNGITYIYELK